MLKQMTFRKLAVTSVSLFLIGLIYLLPNFNEVPLNTNVSYVEEENLQNVFLLDKNNYVSEVKANIEGKNIDEILNNKLKMLIDNEKKLDNIPSNFNTLIPKNTKVLSLIIEKDTVTVDFSKEILSVSSVLEEKMIEAIVYTLTSEEQIKKVIIKVEGEILERLPNSNKLLPNIFDRTYGINKDYDIDNLNNLTKTTIYYLNKDDDLTYYVPVTKVNNTEEEKITLIVSELKSSLLYQSNLMSYLNSDVELKKYKQEEEVMKLTFNDKIFDSIYDKNILEEVIYTIGMSTKENYDVEKVVFYVNDEEVNTFK